MQLGHVGEGVEGVSIGFSGDDVGIRVSAGRICRGVGAPVLSMLAVSVATNVGDGVGFKVGRLDEGRGVGVPLGFDVIVGDVDGTMNSVGRLEVVGDKVVGRREGEFVGAEVMIMGTTGESVGNSEGDTVGDKN